MATINLTTRLDKTGIDRGFDELAKAPDKFTNAVKKSAKDSKKALEDLGKSKNTVPSIVPPVSPKEVNAIKALKTEIRQLQSAALAAGEGTAEYARMIDLAASKKAELKDLQDAVSSLDPDVKAAAFTNLASTAVGAGQGIAGAFAIAGIESKEYEKVLARLQGIDAIGQSIKSVGQISDEWGKAKIALNAYLLKMEAKVFGEQANAVATTAGAVAQEGATVATQANTQAITAQTLAQRALALAQAATPWGAIAIAIGAVVAVIAAYVAHSAAAEKAEKTRNTAADGTVFANQELRDSYNELLLKQKEYRLDMQVLTGQMSKYDAELQKISNTYDQKLNDAQAEFVASLQEEDAWYNKLLPGQATYNKIANITEASKKLEADAIEASNQKKKEELELNARLEQQAAQSGIELQIETLNTQAAMAEAAGKKTFDIQRQIAEKEAELGRMRANTAEDSANQLAIVEEQLKQKLINIDKAQADEQVKIAKEAADERIRIQEGLFSRLAELQKQVNADDQATDPKVRAKQELEANLKAIDQLGRESAQNRKSLTAEQKVELEESLRLLVDQSYRNYYEELTKLRTQQIAEEHKAYEESFNIRLQRLDNSQQIELNDIELWNREVGESEEAFEYRKQHAKLQIQLQFAQTRLALLQEQGAAENAVEVSNLQVLIKSLQGEIEKAEKENKANKKIEEFLKSLLGLTDEQIGNIKKAIGPVLDALKNVLSEQFDAREQALKAQEDQNERELELSQDRIDKMQSQLQLELEAKKAGFANNYDALREDIEREKQAREDQLKEQRRIQQEQARLARLKTITESLQQASGLATSSANLFAVLSPLGPIGIGLAVALIGTMFASFATAKAKALSMSQPPGFKTGTKKAPAGLKWVGEEGPELINDPGGYAIMNNPDSMKLMEQYGIPASYRPDMDDATIDTVRSAASEGRQAVNVVMNNKGTEQRLDQIIEQGQKKVVRTRFKRL